MVIDFLTTPLVDRSTEIRTLALDDREVADGRSGEVRGQRAQADALEVRGRDHDVVAVVERTRRQAVHAKKRRATEAALQLHLRRGERRPAAFRNVNLRSRWKCCAASASLGGGCASSLRTPDAL
jgi:hypothetical protein